MFWRTMKVRACCVEGEKTTCTKYKWVLEVMVVGRAGRVERRELATFYRKRLFARLLRPPDNRSSM